MKSLEEAVHLGDAGQIGAVAMQHNKKVTHHKQTRQLYYGPKRGDIKGDNAALIEGKKAYIQLNDSHKSVWALIGTGGMVLAHSSDKPLRDITMTVRQVIIVEDK